MAGKKFNFIRKNYQIIYSIVLIVIIPLAIIINTVIFTNSFKKAIDQELYEKAIGFGDILNANLAEFLDKPEELQKKIENVSHYNKEVAVTDVLKRQGEDFQIIASSDRKSLNNKQQAMEYTLAWEQNAPVAFLTTSGTSKAQVERYWAVIMPMKDLKDNKQALLSMKVSLSSMDQLTKQILVRSYIILSLTIVIIILLLINNTKLFEYAALYRKLKEVDQMKDEFISMASHELRTPVTGIRGYVSMILDGTFGQIDSKLKDNLTIVENSADRLAILVDDLLNVSRIEQDRIKLEPKPTDVNGIIKSIVAELKIQADQKGLSLNYQAKDGLPLVSIDAERFKQVLINLIGNAIKYTPKGTVEVSVEQKNANLEIKIKDTGIGMSAKARERLFEKFYRVESGHTKDITGTGLGLWITKRLVEMMKGQILVDSIEGVGTQMTLIFPLIKN